MNGHSAAVSPDERRFSSCPARPFKNPRACRLRCDTGAVIVHKRAFGRRKQAYAGFPTPVEREPGATPVGIGVARTMSGIR